MITTPKAGHFWSPFFAFPDRILPKCGKYGGGECRFRRQASGRELLDDCCLHAMEATVSWHGTTSSMGCNYYGGGAFLNERRRFSLFLWRGSKFLRSGDKGGGAVGEQEVFVAEAPEDADAGQAGITGGL